MKLTFKIKIIIAISFALFGCGGSGERGEVPEDQGQEFTGLEKSQYDNVFLASFKERSVTQGTQLFTRLSPKTTGINFQNTIDVKEPLKRLYHSGFVCGGVALGDFNGDTRLDIFLVSGPGKNRLYLQREDFRFEDMSSSSGIEDGNAWGAGVAAVDIENDGDLDLYICNYDSENSLYINDGKGHFSESASRFGLGVVDASLVPTFCDFDKDGDLDVYILTNRYYREGGRPAKPPFQKNANGGVSVSPDFQKFYGIKQKGPKSYDMDEIGRPDFLFRNDGGSFVNISKSAGIQKEAHGLSATWWDYDEDGLMDIYVANDFADPDNLFRNNGDGTFTDIITEVLNYTPWFSMGADAGDINNDGLLD
ncbi:MAG: VCBS repeat-containing protein, partial [Verrucomicrobiota bacterium]|nr:VCBS repeat-containing protein [Verrucomicrobiota bacterium]